MSWAASPLVGRTRELGLVREARLRAANGRCALVLVESEAGFGKSRLVGEALLPVQPDDVVSVSCHEGDRRPLSVVDRIGIALAQADGPAWERGLADPFAAGERLADRIRAAGRERFVVVVIEDLHWADPLSLEALVPLGAALAEPGVARVLLVVTYRPFELGKRAEAVVARLAASVQDVTHCTLEPLTSLEVNALVIGLGFGRPSGRLLDALVETCAGSPLHVQTVMSRLDRSGRLRKASGMVDTTSADLSAELGRDAVGAIEARLDLIDPATTRLLGLAALLDPPVELRVLAEVAGLSPGATADRLAAVGGEGLVTVGHDCLSFGHPLVRSALTRRLSPTSRDDHELAIAHFLLAAGDRASTATAARHLARVRHGAEPPLVRDVCGRGAEEATAAGDYGLAAELAEAALGAAARMGDAGSVAVGRVHCTAAFAHFRNHDREAWRPHVEAARRIAAAHDDHELSCRVELVATRAEMTFGPHPVDSTSLERLLDAAGLEPSDRARVLEILAEVRFGSGDHARGAQLAADALSLAQQAGDVEAELTAHFAAGLNAWATVELATARRHFETCDRLAGVVEDRWLATWGLGRLSLCRRMEGRLEEVLVATGETAARATALGDWSELALASAMRVSVYAAYGDEEGTMLAAKEALEFGARGDYVWAPSILVPALAGLHAERGRSDDAERALSLHTTTGSPAPRAFRQLTAVLSGDRDALRALFVPRRLRAPVTAMTLAGYCVFALAAAETEHVEAAGWAADDLDEVATRGVLFPVGCNVLVPRALGAALRVSGRLDEARTWLDRAVERGTLCGALPEVARAYFELALLEAGTHGKRTEARDHVVRSLAIARRLGLAPLADRAARLGLSLGHFEGDAALLGHLGDLDELPPLVGAILFTDMVDSTRQSRRVTDARWARVLAEHDERLRACLSRFGGVEFAHTGDGIGAYFPTSDAAVACAIAIHESLGAVRSPAADTPGLAVRVGICWGSAVARGRDLAGSDIARCVRIMSIGDAGATTMDERVAHDIEGVFPLGAIGVHHLKSFEDEPQLLFRLVPA